MKPEIDRESQDNKLCPTTLDRRFQQYCLIQECGFVQNESNTSWG
ncbi:hypothetical protein [Chamaesiphon polymorphus]|nr:hypothetical protein [Chamaesiphon polymorphus]